MENRVGWREWVALPDLGIPALKAKIDTGAKTSALHSFEVETFEKEGVDYVRFLVHPIRRKKSIVLQCEAPVSGRKIVRDSGGHSEERFVIHSTVILDQMSFTAEFTLTNRDDMLFPMLLGRRAMQDNSMVVDVNESYLHGRLKPRKFYSY